MNLSTFCKMNIIALLLLSLGAPLSARSKTAKSCAKKLKYARYYYDNLKFNETEESLKDLAQDKTCSKTQQASGWRLLGMTRVVLNDEAGAKQAFTHLLQLDSNAQLDPGLSPKMTRFFTKTKSEFIESWQVAFKTTPRFSWCKPIGLETARKKNASRRLCLQATLVKAATAPRMIPVLFSRQDPRQAFAMTTVQNLADGRLDASIPVLSGTHEDLSLEYFLRVDGLHVHNVAQAGSEQEPLTWHWKAPKEQKNWLKDYRVWLAVGGTAGLVSVAVLTSVAMTSAPQSAESSLGTFSLGQ